MVQTKRSASLVMWQQLRINENISLRRVNLTDKQLNWILSSKSFHSNEVMSENVLCPHLLCVIVETFINLLNVQSVKFP